MKTYLQGADGSERTLTVTEPDPSDGSYCAHLDDETWVRIVPFLTTVELFNLGAAYGSFCTGDIDQGIHLVLPVKDVETGELENTVFEDLFDLFNKIDTAVEDYSDIGQLYIDAIISWTTTHNIDIARQQG